MAITHSLWLPAFAMAASALATHFYISQDTRRFGDDLKWEADTLDSNADVAGSESHFRWRQGHLKPWLFVEKRK